MQPVSGEAIMALDHSIFTQLGIYDGPWNRPVTNPLLGNGTAGNDDIKITNIGAGLVVNGMGGNDRITFGIDLLTGTANGGDGSDQIYGSNGINILNGGNGNDYIEGGGGVDTLSGGAGIDTVGYASATGAVNVNLLTNLVTGAAGADVISGFENIVGSDFGDTLTGNAGDNMIFGLGGNDTINGGDGNDYIEGVSGADTLTGGAGIDTLGYSTAFTSVVVTLNASGGASVSGVGAGGDVVLSGFENIAGSQFNDFLTGNAGDNMIFGQVGNDTINGGDGNDLIFGNRDGDQLIGGNGADFFVYSLASDSPFVDEFGFLQDSIYDFSHAEGDKIDVSRMAGDQAFTFVGNGNFSGGGIASLRYDAGELTADVDGNGSSDMRIHMLDLASPLTAQDFIL
ncbi:Ca2+-binding RTX toxin-like protein [Phyllobacterium sp. 1468]|uniref:calcium-binding protein n=1 Tax=Phyllobacterium sp. 1468 TaxID=2817759 RepID=UPI0028556EA3|nr:calcium-binding protein [Phyllobacterium sp. 1468]MDR6633881.1 Ca2+-binding RTX toxin-like protein [Phyllobacterium sp. 1468]